MAPRGWRRGRALLLVGAALGALLLATPPSGELETRAHLPDAPAHLLAHVLADFSHQPHVGAWRVLDDGGNYTSWRYSVEFECGARCAGRALVAAHDEHDAAPQRGAAARSHRVQLSERRCTRLPLLPVAALCDAVEVEWLVTRAGAGCSLRTRAAARCSPTALWRGGCEARLRAHLDALLLRARAALPAHAPPAAFD